MNRFAIALLVAAGCSGTEAEPNEVGITYNAVQDDLVAGTFDTQYGSLAFESRVTSDGVVEVRFDRGGSAFGSHVDWNTLTTDLVFEDGHTVTNDDRFLLRALASSLENDLDGALPAADNLIRQANVWGVQPDGAVGQRQIVADPDRLSWTTLCNVNNYTFGHDANSHGWQNEYLACGRYETSNPCRDRCGAGCKGWGTSAWTKHCGDHDRCEQLHSSTECAGEAYAASDDFSFAPNCSY